ncbi:MAG: hypothetical protein HQK84_06455 [Nitrospinae bacterium]|nr:hypothetical protein [Nitrospinota bacterium]
MISIYSKIKTLFIIIFLLCAYQSFANNLNSITGNTSTYKKSDNILYSEEYFFKFAQSLYKVKNYQEAIIEFKRFVYFFPNSNNIDKAVFFLGTSNYFLHRYDQAISLFRYHMNKYPESNYDPSIFLSLAYYEKGSFLNAALFIEKSKKNNFFLNYVQGWAYMQLNNYQKAQEVFIALQTKGYEVENIKNIIHSLNKLTVPDKIKSPQLAGVLSLLPGAGQTYVERYKDATVAFFLNGTFIYLVWKAFKKRNFILGAIASFIEAGWYFGGIYGSVRGAEVYNHTVEDITRQNLLELNKINLLMEPYLNQ